MSQSLRFLLSILAALALAACSEEPVIVIDGGPDGSVPVDGAAASVCGGPDHLTCGADSYCEYPAGSICGDDGFPGLCRPAPEECGEISFPVCGCDGVTYDNPCLAHAAGVAVRQDGACDRPAFCGVAGASCEANEWCDAPAGSRCGAVGGGVCRTRPEVCALIYAPVCGCDGVTYSNSCHANASGIDVAYEGECADERVCGGIGGFECAPGEWCDFPTSAACGIGDVRGLCERMPIVCPTGGDPVCGCDGVTYPSACVAALAGVDVAHPNECRADDPCAAQDARGGGDCALPLGVFWDGTACRARSGCECVGDDCADGFDSVAACEAAFDDCAARTCASDTDCDAGEWCDYPVGALCGATEELGLCRPRPDICLPVYRAVCGCDGTTYGNPCEAALAGSDVAYVGACDSADRCAPQDATGVGPCEAELGWFWDGAACVLSSGCECRGTACGFGWPTASECEAAHLGCDDPGDACTPSDPCPTGMYCDYEGPTCGGEPGVCLPRPPVCPPTYALVCGCDGFTYTNACEAARAGEDVRYPGACVRPPGT